MEGKEIKILVVEDEAGMAMLLQRILENLGYGVLPIEKTGLGAIESAQKNHPAIILMDIYLEGEMNGIQAAEKILAQQNIPVIYATSDSDEKTIKSARSTYPLGYILKPYNKNILKSTIEVALSIREVEARKNQELRSAYETISSQTVEILESFKSAKEIQRAILPSENNFAKYLPNSFILNLPKESLGGDFFWYKPLRNGELLFAVIDCTGHGVPGALMSILVNYQLTKALAQLNEGDELGSIFSTVDQVLSDTYEDQLLGSDSQEIQNLNAGFDGILGLLSKDRKTLTFCGAKRPLILIRNGKVTEYKGNRSSVGLFTLADKGFLSQEIELQKGDSIFMYSDGYADQIGGDKGKRLKSTAFKEKLQEVATLEPHEQKLELASFFDTWKGIYEQTDDVLLLGYQAV